MLDATADRRRTTHETLSTEVWLAAALLAALLAAPVAMASDGEIEINQASVMAAGGFPLVIDAPGSYRLTSNLDPGGANGIQATVPGVLLDLGGFSIIGPGSCTATIVSELLSSVDCSGNAGIGLISVEQVRNGIVRGFTTGILSGFGELRLDRVHVSENSGNGVGVSTRFIATDSTFSVNVGSGVSGQSDTAHMVVRNSIFVQNGRGLYLGAGVVQGSFFAQNGIEGIRSNVGRGGSVTDSYFEHNATGIVGTTSVGIGGCSFDENTTDISGTFTLAPNVCDGVLCP